ncbi:MAG: cation-transporting P-type ATPase [Polyangiaceae bacterium]|nr:cation-transporting P-type ATPase [Polyangiaceae bacterium]
MHLHRLTIDQVLENLRTSEQGLSSAEAQKRLGEHGPNEVERHRGEPITLRLLHAFANFFAVILWVAAFLSFFAHRTHPGEGMGTLGAAILGVILINGAFSFWQEQKAERALAELERLLPQNVKVVRDASPQVIPRADLVPGDIVVIEEGDEVPADARVIEAHHLRVVEAAMTGESEPRDRTTGVSDEQDTASAQNMILAGTQVVSGRGKAVVTATAMTTELGKIARLTQTAGDALSPLQREIVRLSRMLAVVATTLGVGFFVVGRALHIPFWESFLFGIGILVANVPEGLLPTVTLALAMASQRMAKRNVLIRHLPSVEALGCASVICTDKTGTLTQNKMFVSEVYTSDLTIPVQDVHTSPQCLSLLKCAAECHSLSRVNNNGESEFIGDPMEIALVTLAAKIPETASEKRIDEMPFDADRRRLSVLADTRAGRFLFTKGALETVLPLCAHIETEGAVVPIRFADCDRITAAQNALAERGLRVLAFASRRADGATSTAAAEHALTFLGLVALHDPPRPEVPDAVAKCHDAGIRMIMITGDHPTTAVAVARSIGMVRTQTPTVVTGTALAKMNDAELGLALDAEDVLFARTKPEQKMRIVQALQRKKHVVAVTGDGVNDAPALKCADVGVAMGKSGTDVARGAADIVLADDNFASIVAGIEEGRAVFANIRKFLTYILTSNVPELVPYLAFVLLRIPLPLTILQILAVDLGTDMLPALALGVEPPASDVMLQKPRSRAEHLLDRATLLRAYLFLGLFESAVALAGFFFVLHLSGWHYGQETVSPSIYREATAATFTGIVLAQVVNLFLCRSETKSAFSATFRNRFLWIALAVEVLILIFIVYTPPGQAIFNTGPVRKEALFFMVPFALAMVLAEEIRKALVRRARPKFSP